LLHDNIDLFSHQHRKQNSNKNLRSITRSCSNPHMRFIFNFLMTFVKLILFNCQIARRIVSSNLCHAFKVVKNILGNLRNPLDNSRAEDTPLPRATSSLYIAQHCLIHLGDVARYRHKQKMADSFYRKASHLVPSSGHPYNQLAILAATSPDNLQTGILIIQIFISNCFSLLLLPCYLCKMPFSRLKR